MARRLFALLRSLVFAAIFVSLWTWFFPHWFAAGRPLELALAPWNLALMIAGALIMILCVFEFAWTGLGTPAPIDPPRHLVVKGLYQWVRNPMYVGMALFLIGEAFALPLVTRPMLILLAILAVAINVFIVVYEEPTLRRLFGEDYRRYCANVRRWIPRLKPWSP